MVQPGDIVTVPPSDQHLTVERLIEITGNSENMRTHVRAVLTCRNGNGTTTRFTAPISNLQPVEVPT